MHVRILLAEDDQDLAVWLSRLLRRDHYVIDCVHRGDEADAALTTYEYALVILDLGLPIMSGLEVLRRLRARGSRTPVLILTSNDAVSSRVAGLDGGADDYLVKPFSVDELEARIRARLRRSNSASLPSLSVGELAFDPVGRAFTLRGTTLGLTPREHATLEALLQRAGRPVSKDSLSEAIFGFDDEASPSAVEIYVHRIRRKLEGSGVEIVTMRGLGYVLRRSGAPA